MRKRMYKAISLMLATTMIISGCTAKKDTNNNDNSSNANQSNNNESESKETENKIDDSASADTVAPVITVTTSSYSIPVGEDVNFLEGVTAIDDVDGDITSSIKVDQSAVDFYTAGEYDVVLSVTDAAGNMAEQIIKLTVKPETNEQFNPAATEVIGDYSQYSTERIPFGVGSNFDEVTNRPTGLDYYTNLYGNYAADFILPDSGYVYLTFDEGYENGYTPTILDTLKEKNVKAVFFVTLPFAKENPELMQRMIDEGHMIGNHTVNHPSDGLQSLSVDEQIYEIKEVNDYVLENFGYQMKLFRFPTGAFSEQSLAIVQSLGYRSVFWSFAHRDWVVDDQPDITEALNNAVAKSHSGAIYLLHAVSSTNTQMLGDFIDQVRAKGLEFGDYANMPY